MFIFLIILSWICIYGLKICPVKEFNTGYMSKDNTTAVKGIFVYESLYSILRDVNRF